MGEGIIFDTDRSHPMRRTHGEGIDEFSIREKTELGLAGLTQRLPQRIDNTVAPIGRAQGGTLGRQLWPAARQKGRAKYRHKTPLLSPKRTMRCR